MSKWLHRLGIPNRYFILQNMFDLYDTKSNRIPDKNMYEHVPEKAEQIEYNRRVVITIRGRRRRRRRQTYSPECNPAIRVRFVSRSKPTTIQWLTSDPTRCPNKWLAWSPSVRIRQPYTPFQAALSLFVAVVDGAQVTYEVSQIVSQSASRAV